MTDKKKTRTSLISAVLVFVLVHFWPLFLGLHIVWRSTTPVELDVPFPQGTEIVEQWDTHKGLFRLEGTAVVVARIPQEHRTDFYWQLRAAGFSVEAPSTAALEQMTAAEHPDVAVAASSQSVLWTYRFVGFDLAVSPFPDCFAAIYDPNTGICCYVEFDG